MILTSTSDIIRIVTSSTADIHAQTSWADMTTTAFTPGRTNTVITSATTTTIIASPGASTQRQVKTIVLYNAHASTSNTVTVQHYDGTTSNNVYKYALAAGESIEYNGSNWIQFDANGVSKSTTSLGILSSAQLAAAITDETGSGAAVFATSPTLVTPLLGTPTSGTLTNCTGLPVAGGGTGIATTTAYSVICAGTTATGAFQSLAALGATGTRLTSAGAGALPSFKGGLTAFNAYRATNQSITASTPTKVILDTETLDTGSYFDSSTNYRYTPLIAGKYFFSLQCTFANVFTAGVLCTGAIFKNGSAVVNTLAYSSLINEYVSLPCNIMLDMNGSTDYVEAWVTQYEASSARNLLGGAVYNTLSGVLMEPA